MTAPKYVPPHLRNQPSREEKDDVPGEDDRRGDDRGKGDDRRKGEGKGKSGGYPSRDREDRGFDRRDDRGGDRGQRNDRRDDRDDRGGRDYRGGKGGGRDNDRDDRRDKEGEAPSRFDCLKEDDEQIGSKEGRDTGRTESRKGGGKGDGGYGGRGGGGNWKGESKDLRDRIRNSDSVSLDWNKRQDGRRGEETQSELEVFGEKKDRSTAGIDFDSYSKIPVEVSGNATDCLKPIDRFSEAKLAESLFENLQRCGYDRPTPIQKHAIPIVVSGRDLMGCAQTGSGKTCAFMVPCIESLLRSGPPPMSGRRNVPQPCGLVLAPTRELASQIHAESLKFSWSTGIRCCIVYGGADMREQRRELGNGCDILIATPGRLTDMFERGNVSLAVISFFILDEADRMLDMGFEPQVRQIVEKTDMGRGLRTQRQSMMFSATFPREVQFMARDFLNDYVFITIGRVGSASELIQQKVVYAEDGPQKVRALERTLKDLRQQAGNEVSDRLIVIFVETKRGADSLERDLWQAGVSVTAIHGDRSQSDREEALHAFRTGQNPILVATDVAARGLDIPNVAVVVNFDMPKQLDDYVHRIGRTGRAGRKGVAISFVNEKCSFLSQLQELLSEAKQELPVWFEELCKQRRWGGGGKSGGKSSDRFGGRDLRASDESFRQNTNSTEKPKRNQVEVRRDTAPKKDDAWGNTGVEDAWSD